MIAVDDTLGARTIRTSAFRYNDLQLRFKTCAYKRFELYFGVNNIADKQPPRFGHTNLVTFPGTQTSATTYDLYGRMLYAGLDVRF